MSLSAIGVVSAINECVTLWQWAKSAISSRWSGSHDQILQDRVLQLESGLQLLRDTLPAMHDLINKAEWKSHERGVASLLPNLKDAVCDAEDLLDEFRWYELKLQVEGDANQSSLLDFFGTVIPGSFDKLNDVQLRLNHLSIQMENMGLRGVTQHFDKLVRPETTSLPNETKIFGRDKELKQVLGFLNVPMNSKRKRATCSVNASTSNLVNDTSRIYSLPILPIVGIGGVGKTTLSQHICNHQRVKSHFELIIWICVSDNFDVKRLTKEVIQSCNGKEATTDNLDSLQRALSNHVKNKRVLIVLDDMWDDSLKENGQCWKRFCAPFTSVQEGSMMLITTRCPKVAEGVRTMEHIKLEGLEDSIFWKFFKLCAFGSENSINDPELECIGRRILPKLKGSPLAAKTLGRMLSMDMQASHWNSILVSELWELRQEDTDILPALRLSYMYLPFYLKQCFAFCAVYPKDYKFQKACLAEIWVAEGFVDPQGRVPIEDIGCRYFEDLVARSFFQKASGGYIIHDLLHDMAQKVSEHDCFILRNKSEFDKVPQNVRHLYVLPSNDFDDSTLLRLSKYTKLRTLICKKNLGKMTGFVLDHWCTKLMRMRVISCASTNELPESIGNWKHLRYLEISRACPLKRIPSTFCWLYNLQILYAKKCKLDSLPSDFDKLTCLQKFESLGLAYCARNNTTLNRDHATEAEPENRKYLDELTLVMGSDMSQPPIGLKSLFLKNYGGSSLPSWFQPQNLPSLASLGFESCDGLKSINLNERPAVGGSITTFSFLTVLTVKNCDRLSTLDDLLTQEYIPAIEKIHIEDCPWLLSVPGQRFGSFCYLKHLAVIVCPSINWQRGLVLPSSLRSLSLLKCGDISPYVPSCLKNLASLVSLNIDGLRITSIPGNIWHRNLASLEELEISDCPDLVSIGGAKAVAKIKRVLILRCPKLEEAEQINKRTHLKASMQESVAALFGRRKARGQGNLLVSDNE
ncbi:putative disease resistance RPP13-like protein 1 [Triticum dicoccoides]|uniref:putative disease resistance RPP13-like protein 1 n=1 Tax=Triticum dicoccoides TaxID=85692 RepID=UPI00188E979E|nr:putative disease resistance RPP13-like protein 1 [Triticum dicoccoides]